VAVEKVRFSITDIYFINPFLSCEPNASEKGVRVKNFR
jgi:hypothetical protein